MRLVNRPLAFILAVAVIAVCVVAIAEVIGFFVHRSPLLVHWTTWYHWAGVTRWNAAVVRVWSAILIAVGVLILAAELKPRRATRLPLREAAQATDSAVTRRGLARILKAEAAGVDGINGASGRIRRHRARVTAVSGARGRVAASALTEPLTQALDARIDSIQMRHAPRLSVRVVPRGR